jgi:hypothetical protein
MKSDVKSYALE